jgi:hypothetical protein
MEQDKIQYDLLGRGSYANIGYCPGTSRDANGYNRNFRYKEIFNVANTYVYVV